VNLRAVLLAMFSVLCLACTSDEQTPATNTPLSSPTSAADEAVATIAARPTPTPVPAKPEKVFWLIDVASGDVATLVENYDKNDWQAGFDDSSEHVFAWSRDLDVQIEFDLKGNEVGRTSAPERVSACESLDPILVDGREHPSLRCIDFEGLPRYISPGEPVQYFVAQDVSPDGDWYVYEMDESLPTQAPVSGPGYDLWALNLESGERWRLGGPLYSCGGCDGPSGSGWSHSGRYYVHMERGPQRRAMLVDFAARTITDISWPGEFGGTSVSWSPVADVILRTAGPLAMAITNLETGVEHIIPGLQPLGEFDATGRFAYARSGSGRDETLGVVDVATGELVHAYPGFPSLVGADLFGHPRPLVATPQGIVVVTEESEDCEGVLIIRDRTLLSCISGGDYPVLSPDASKVALVRETAGPTQTNPGREEEYEIVIYDLETDSEFVAAEGARGHYAPIIKWNAASTHILVEWPAYRGL